MATNLGTVYGALELRLTKLRQQMAEAKRELGGVGKSLDTLGRQSKAVGQAMSLSLTAPLLAIGKVSVDTAVRMDSLRRGLTAVMGSSQAAGAELRKLREVAKLPGLGMEEAIQGSIRLQAVGMNANLSRRALIGVGNALATVGAGKAELDGVILALTQIVSKGKVSAEEINQIAERMPQVRQILKDAFGTADTEVLQKAEIGVEEFVSTVVSQLERIPRVTGGAQNAFENFSDELKDLKQAIGDAALPTLTRWMEALTPHIKSATDWFQKLTPQTRDFLTVLGAGLAAGGPVLMGLGALTNALKGVNTALLALARNPAIILLTAGSALAAAWGEIASRMEARGAAPMAFGPGAIPYDNPAARAARDRARQNAIDDAAYRAMGEGRAESDRAWREMQAQLNRQRTIDAAAKKAAADAAKRAAEQAAELHSAILDYRADLEGAVAQALRQRQQDLNRGIPRGLATQRLRQTLEGIFPDATPKPGAGFAIPYSPAGTSAVERSFAQMMRNLGSQMRPRPGGLPLYTPGSRTFGAESLNTFGGYEGAVVDLAAAMGRNQRQTAEKLAESMKGTFRELGRTAGDEIGQALRGAVADAKFKRSIRDGFSFMRDLAGEIGNEFYHGFRDKLVKLFGGGSLARILGNSISRSLSRMLDTTLDNAVQSLFKKGGPLGGKGIASGEHRFTWGSVGGILAGAALGGIAGKVLGGGLGKVLGGLFRASGGPVSYGMPYIVGERGPELFVPRSAGTVMPNHALAGAGGTNVNITIPGLVVRSEADIHLLGAEIARQVRNGGRVRPGS